MKNIKDLEFKLRDFIPIYGAGKDITENKNIYKAKSEELSEYNAGMISLKLSTLLIYNALVIKGLYLAINKYLM